MKRVLSLLIVLCLVLGLSGIAWADGEIGIISSTPNANSSIGYTKSVFITVEIPQNSDDAKPYGSRVVYTLTSNADVNINHNTSDGKCTLTVPASVINTLPNRTVTFKLTKEITPYDSAGVLGIPEAGIPAGTESWGPFTIAPQITMSASDVSVTCSGSGANKHSFSISGSGTQSNPFKCNIPLACSNANHTLTLNANPTGLTANIQYPNVDANGSSPVTRTIVVSNGADDPVTYYMQFSREVASTDTSMSKVELKSGSTVVGTASGTTRSITVANSYTGSLSITATANDKAKSAVVSPTSITLTNAGQPYTFTVLVTAESGATLTHSYTVTRQAAAAVNLVTGITLRTGNGSASGSQVGTALGTVTSANYNTTTRSIQIPASLRSTTTFYAYVPVPSGVSLSATNGNYSSSTGMVTLNIPSATTSHTLTLTATTSGTNYSIPITITRETTTSILKSISFTYSGSTLGSIGAVSGTSTQSLNLNTSASSVNVSWVLADGATLASATWNGGNISSGASIGLSSSGTRALVLKINASNGTQYTATINVSRSGTATNTLDSLYIKSSVTSSTNSSYRFSTSPSSFSSNTLDYKVYVDSDTDTIYVYPTPTSSGASVSINNGAYDRVVDRYSSNGYFQVDLRSGSNTVKINVTANSTTTVYILTIEREEDVVTNASLDSMYVSKSSTSTSSSNRYDLSPSFSYNRTKYDVDLAKSVSEVYLHFTTHKSNASLSVSNATKVSDGVYKATLTTNKTKAVTVTVSYSNDSTKYTINLNSGNATSYAQLSNIRVASTQSSSSRYQYTILPDFDSSVTDYVAMIPYESSGSYAYVQATLDDDDDTLRVDGSYTDSGDWTQVSISRGKSVSVPIKVTDDDSNTTTYNLKIVAAERNADDDADLESLSLRTGSSTSTSVGISPNFSDSTTKYTASNVSNSTSSMRVYAEASDSDAWIIVNNVLMTGDYATIDLDEGQNTIEVLVYATDCETHRTYTITVNRGVSGSADSSLSGLEARYGSSDGQILNLIPTFTKGITSYRINVDGSVAQIAFRPTASDDGASIMIMGKEETSGQWTSYNALSNGKNEYLIIVTSGDGNNKSYYSVAVERGLKVVVSGQKLQVNGTEVTCAAYNINDNNYFKLRDIAFALRGTSKSFDVTYNSSTRIISMTSGRNYSIIGGEMLRPVAPGKYQLSNQPVMLDGRSITLTAYNVDGNNYFMLREIGQLFNFGVEYDSSRGTVSIDSSKDYTVE